MLITCELWSKKAPTPKEHFKNFNFKAGISSYLITLPTKTIYYHSELVYKGWAYSSTFSQGVRKIPISSLKKEEFDIVEVHDINKNDFFLSWDMMKNKKYDYLNIFLSQIIRLNIHDKDTFICSEVVAKLIGLTAPNSYNPRSLHNLALYLNKLKKTKKQYV